MVQIKIPNIHKKHKFVILVKDLKYIIFAHFFFLITILSNRYYGQGDRAFLQTQIEKLALTNLQQNICFTATLYVLTTKC